MTIGVCYFPEQWPRERWATDVEQMAEAGIEYVRMGEFAWSRIEPGPGDLRLDWLEAAVDLVHEQGMTAVLCTPTATPPKWLVDRHPDILQAEPDGTLREFGGRRHYCFNSPTYREETERIVTAVAERFADHPGVTRWQIDNEFGCHGTIRCYCDDCARAFRTWLREKYGDSETLNDVWGTTFWSQHHTDFDEVDPPGHTMAEHHPSRLLDFYRFASDSVVEYNRFQADLLRAVNDDWRLTHNFMGNFESLDSFAGREALDFVSWDSYPTGFAQLLGDPDERELRAGDPDQVGLNHDLYREETVWVMEQQSGDVNWSPHAPQPGAGAMRLWAHHATGHGADAVCYFRWRRCLEGQEQYHAGLRTQDGSPDRAYAAASEVTADLADLDPDPVDAPVAVLCDYEDLWALSIQPHGADFDYWTHLGRYYEALRERGVAVDIVHPDTDLAAYDAVVAPTLHLVGDDRATDLTDYVEGGGQLLLTVRSGAKTPGNRLRPEPAPGPLADLVGATVAQHESLPRTLEAAVRYDGERYPYRSWAEWLDVDDATVLADHRTGEAVGRPAITRAERGDGRVDYVGVWPRTGLARTLVSDLLAGADVHYTPVLPEGVRLCRRGDLTWVTNFAPVPVQVHATDAEWVVGEGTVQGYDASVVTAPPHELTVERTG